MSEKRFKLAEDSNGLFSIFDNEDPEDEPLIYGARFGTEKIVDLLNELEEEKGYWKRKAMTLLMQVRRLTPRMTDKEVIEFSKELDDE